MGLDPSIHHAPPAALFAFEDDFVPALVGEHHAHRELVRPRPGDDVKALSRLRELGGSAALSEEPQPFASFFRHSSFVGPRDHGPSVEQGAGRPDRPAARVPCA